MPKKRNFDDVSFESDSCSICLTALAIRNHAVTPCGHHFCMTCITQHLFYKQTCPICREHFNIPNKKKELSGEESTAIVVQNIQLFPFNSMLKHICEKIGVSWGNLTPRTKAHMNAILREHIQGYSMGLVFDVASHSD